MGTVMRGGALLGLAILAGCAECPTFAEMEVVDKGREEHAGEVSLVEHAIATFAAWTGREGVCVPTIEVREGVGPLGPPVWDVVPGYYQGPNRPIVLNELETPTNDGTVSVFSDTLHLLCHALDDQEGLSDSVPHLFQDVETSPVDQLYSLPGASPEVLSVADGASRRREVFADLCASSLRDRSLDLALDEACDPDWMTEEEEFVAAEVHGPGSHPIPITIGEDAPAATGWRRLTGIDVQPWYLASGIDGGVVIAGPTPHYTGPGELDQALLVQVASLKTGRVEREVVIPGVRGPEPDIYWPMGIVSGERDVWVFAKTNDGSRMWAVEGDGWRRIDLGLGGGETIYMAALSEDAVYALIAMPDRFRISRWDRETLERSEMATEGLDSLFPWAMWWIDGSLELLSAGGYARLEGDRWESWPAPSVAGQVLARGDERVFLADPDGYAPQPIVFDLATETWTLHPRCTGPAGRGAGPVVVDGESWMLGRNPTNERDPALYYAPLGL